MEAVQNEKQNKKIWVLQEKGGAKVACTESEEEVKRWRMSIFGDLETMEIVEMEVIIVAENVYSEEEDIYFDIVKEKNTGVYYGLFGFDIWCLTKNKVKKYLKTK